MKTLYILMSHDMTEQQKNDAKYSLGVNVFDVVPSKVWSQIPSEYETVEACLTEIKTYISAGFQRGDYLLVQGDYGATFNMVQFAKEKGIVPVYATSRRKAYEVVEGEKITTVKEFQHVRFREF